MRTLLALGAVLALAAGPARADDVRILATGVFAASLRDLAVPFHAETGHDLKLVIANAGRIATKVLAGEPGDVVMTSATGLEALERKGRAAAGSAIDIGRMRLGVGVRADAPIPDISSPERFRALLLASSGIAYIDSKGGATAGAFFEKVFETLGVADAVHAKRILCADGSEVVAALVSGKATVGLTQASEILGAPGVAFAGGLPDSLNAVTLYSAALIAKPTPSRSAIAFLRFMTGPVARKRLHDGGWDVAPPP